MPFSITQKRTTRAECDAPDAIVGQVQDRRIGNSGLSVRLGYHNTEHPVKAIRLRVRANDELVLDAGTAHTVTDGDGRITLIRQPKTTLFHQVMAYLRAKADPPGRRPRLTLGREGVATAAIVLRWGSYLSVLFDRNKPIWAACRSEQTSRISDGEMARINIESSAALAEWIDLRRTDDDGNVYARLVDRAIAYLAMPQRTVTVRSGPFMALADVEMGLQLLGAVGATNVKPMRRKAGRHASRLFANALINTAWRNGPIENIHAGGGGGYPMALRRVTTREERTLMRVASEGLGLGLATCDRLKSEQTRRPWPEQVLPFCFMPWVAPNGWTLTEDSRDFRLQVGAESA